MNCLSFKKKLGFVSLFTLSSLLAPSSLMAMNPDGTPKWQGEPPSHPTYARPYLGASMNSSSHMNGVGLPPSSFPPNHPYSSLLPNLQPLSASMLPSGAMNSLSGSSSMPSYAGTHPNQPVNLSASSATALVSDQKPYVPTKLLCPSLEEVNKLILKAKSEVFTEEVGKAQDTIINLATSGSYASYLTAHRIGFLDWKKGTITLEDYVYDNDAYLTYAMRQGCPVTHFPKLPTVVQKRANEGSVVAQATLGLLYRHGRGVEKNPEKAIEFFTKSGLPWAKAQLVRMYENGTEVPKDLQKALDFLKEAAEGGHLGSQAQYGHVVHNGRGGVNKNEQEGIKLYTQAALRGNEAAQGLLGLAYKDGKGVEPDQQRAVEWLTRSALQGSLPSCHTLGQMFNTERGVEKNRMAAFGYHKIGQQKQAAAFLATLVSPTPLSLTVPQKSWKETLEAVLTTLTGWVMHHRQEIATEKEHKDLAASNYIKWHQKVLTVEEEAFQMAYDLLKHYKLGFTLVPGVQFSEEALKDFPKQAVPQQVVQCSVDGVLCYSFGTDNIDNQNRLLTYRKQVKDKFKSADKALKNLRKVFLNQQGSEIAQATLRKIRQDTEKKEDCQVLLQKIKEYQYPLDQNEQEREDLAKIGGYFKTLPHSIAQENHDEFFKQLQ